MNAWIISAQQARDLSSEELLDAFEKACGQNYEMDTREVVKVLRAELAHRLARKASARLMAYESARSWDLAFPAIPRKKVRAK